MTKSNKSIKGSSTDRNQLPDDGKLGTFCIAQSDTASPRCTRIPIDPSAGAIGRRIRRHRLESDRLLYDLRRVFSLGKFNSISELTVSLLRNLPLTERRLGTTDFQKAHCFRRRAAPTRFAPLLVYSDSTVRFIYS